MKTLLHLCSANCAIYPVKTLRERGDEVTGYFFNPNSHPYQECCDMSQLLKRCHTSALNGN